MKIIVTSKNKAKCDAVSRFFDGIGMKVEVIPLSVESLVSNTPDSHEEGVLGCKNRISEAKKLVSEYDYIIGMEGIIIPYDFGTALCGWVVLEDNKGNQSMGCSAQCMLPKEITEKLTKDIQLSEIVINQYPDRAENISSIGTNGILTKGFYTRVDEFEDAMRCTRGSMI